jgi:integrase
LAARRISQVDQDGSLGKAIADASGTEKGSSGVARPELVCNETDFVFPSLRNKGRKPLDLGAVLNRMIKPAFAKIGIAGVGWHTFRHSVGSMLADMGEHQLTIRDYLRHSNLNVTNQYLQATSKTKRLAQDKLVDAILPSGSLSASKSHLVQ